MIVLEIGLFALLMTAVFAMLARGSRPAPVVAQILHDVEHPPRAGR